MRAEVSCWMWFGRPQKKVFVPLTVGGGIKTVDDIRDTLRAGADKVSVNSQAVQNPQLIKDGADIFGCQCICVGVDAKKVGENKWTERTIAFDYTLPKHIIYGFPGYYGINIQQHAAFMVPILNKNLGSYYVDQAVSCGIPGDMCTLPLVETGVAVEGEYPDIGNCWLTTNNPCDANMMDNVAMYRALSSDGKKAVHPFTTPLMYDDPTCKELGVHEVYDAIHFLEEQFHQPFNWDTFIQHIENTNQFNREETERWDIYAKTNNGALNPVCQGLFRIYFYQQGGNEYFLKASRKITRIFDKCVRRNIDTFPHTRHRAIAWSCGSTYYAHGVQWLYNCWGILCLINMTRSPATTLSTPRTATHDERRGRLARPHPMRTHTVGGNRHIMQMWETAEKFNCDMIIMYGRHRLQGHGRCAGADRGGDPQAR